MSAKAFHNALRDLRKFIFVLTAIAGLMLCVTAMHSLPATHTANAATGAATSLAVHHNSQTVAADGLAVTVATCQGPCGQDHYLMAIACGLALLVPFLLIGAASLTATWRPFARRLQDRLQSVGAAHPLMPPSLVFLSISRT